MLVDKLIEEIKNKKNPCIVGIDPEWELIPACYKTGRKPGESIALWGMDVIDAVRDIVPAVKPQMAFFEVYGADGIAVHQKLVAYAHEAGLLVVDDSKRGDIGNTAKAYAFSHLAKEGPINADFLTVSPFLGTDSLQPFVDTASGDGKGLFVLVKTSNPSSVEISEAVNGSGMTIMEWLASYVNHVGQAYIGHSGYSGIGAVVGATFPENACKLRQMMPSSFFLVPGFGAQGGKAADVISCFNDDGLGAIVSSSRGVLYHHLKVADFDNTRDAYRAIVRSQALKMQREVYDTLKQACKKMDY